MLNDQTEIFEEFKRKFEFKELNEEDAETVEASLFEFEKGIYVRVCEKTHFKSKKGDPFFKIADTIIKKYHINKMFYFIFS